MFVGYDFLEDGKDAFLDTSNNVTEHYRTDYTNMIMDEFNLRNNTNFPLTGEKDIWWPDNVMLGEFNGNLEAGSVGLEGLEVTAIRLKKRKQGELSWKQIAEIPYSGSQITYSAIDQYLEPQEEYEYAIIPVSADVEGNYSTSSISSVFEGCYIYDHNQMYRLYYNFELGDVIRITPNSTIETIGGSKYPIVVYNGDVTYNTGSVKCTLIANRNDDVDQREEKRLREKVDQFLSNRRPKIIKNADGLYKLISITGDVTLSPHSSVLGLYDLSFSFVEIGDINDKDTLALYGMGEAVNLTDGN